MVLTIRVTMSSSLSGPMRPLVKSSGLRPSASSNPGRSRPARAAASGSRTANMKSGATNPAQPHWSFSVPSKSGFWQA